MLKNNEGKGKPSSDKSPEKKKPILQYNFFGDLYAAQLTSEVNEVTITHTRQTKRQRGKV